MAKYKIVKKFYFSGQRYFIYKRFFYFMWKREEICMTQQEAERQVERWKAVDEAKAKKPEVIGYY